MKIALWIIRPFALAVFAVLWAIAASLTVYAWLKDYRHLTLREFWTLLHGER